MQWGTQGDIPIENSDFFGNGHADLAVFRPSTGTWCIKDPSTGATITTQWGVQGDVPVYQDLLDWLAVEFRANRWDVKRLHRLIVTSATYKQSARVSAAAAPPANRRKFRR